MAKKQRSERTVSHKFAAVALMSSSIAFANDAIAEETAETSHESATEMVLDKTLAPASEPKASKTNNVDFKFDLSDGAFVFEPEKASTAYLDGIDLEDEQDIAADNSPFAAEDRAEDPDHEEIVAMTEGPSDHVEIKSTHTHPMKISDEVIIIGGRAFEI